MIGREPRADVDNRVERRRVERIVHLAAVQGHGRDAVVVDIDTNPVLAYPVRISSQAGAVRVLRCGDTACRETYFATR